MGQVEQDRRFRTYESCGDKTGFVCPWRYKSSNDERCEVRTNALVARTRRLVRAFDKFYGTMYAIRRKSMERRSKPQQYERDLPADEDKQSSDTGGQPGSEDGQLSSTGSGTGERDGTSDNGDAPSGDGVGAFEVIKTSDRKWQKDHNIQLHAIDLVEFDAIEAGDFLRVSKTHRGKRIESIGKVQVASTHVAPGQVGLGFNLRYAIGATTGDLITIDHVTMPERKRRHRILDDVLKIRPVICRTRRAMFPDPGFKVCRITEETKELLGIDFGNRIVLESPSGRVRGVKALPIGEESQRLKREQIESTDSQYPDCFQELSLENLRSAEVDIPPNYVDEGIRIDLHLDRCAHGGVCQPIKIYRDTEDQFTRLLLDLSTPLILSGAALAIIGFQSDIVRLTIVIAFLLLFIVFSVIYKSRRVFLD